MPALPWNALSEIAFGAVLRGELDPKLLKPDLFPEPYIRGVRLMKDKRRATTEHIMEVIGLSAYHTAYQAAEAMKDLPANWMSLLEIAASNHQLGLYLERISTRLKNGEAVDWGPVKKAMLRSEDGLPQVQKLSDVSLKEGDSDYVKTGYEPFDTWIGGVPRSYMTLIIAPPGSGKTYLWLQLAAAFALRKKRSLLFSLEMTAQSLARRALRQMGLPKKVAEYIYIVDDILSPADISMISARTEDAELVGIDFAELMLVNGERSEGIMADGYLTINYSAKNLGIPHIVLGQTSKAALADFIPAMGAVRYTGMGDILAGLGLSLVTRNQILRKADMNGNANAMLPLSPGNGAVVVYKARFGTTRKEVGAIEVPFNPEKGWGDKSVRWHTFA